ncbi:MAG: hypothetical protein AAB794_00570 [Patescibacteria group bacterium]
MKFSQYVGGFITLLNTVVVPVIAALAFAAFIWGAVNYFFLQAADEKKREEGRLFVLWGIIGLVVLFSVWGLVNLLLSTLGLTPPA